MKLKVLQVLALAAATLAHAAEVRAQSSQPVTMDANFSARSILTVLQPASTGQFLVDQAGPISITIAADDPRVVATLVSPNGAVYNTAPGAGYSYEVYPPPATLGAQEITHVIDVPAAEVGAWTYDISVAGAVTSPIRVSLRADLTSTLRAGVCGAGSLQRADREIMLGIILYEGANPLRGASVAAELRRIDVPGMPVPMVFADDGAQGDIEAGDGIYTGHAPAQPEGVYAFGALITGVRSNGVGFARSLYDSLSVKPVIATVGAGFTDTPLDLDGDGLLDGIRITTEAEVGVAGDFNSIVVLRSSSGGTLAATAQFIAPSIGTYEPQVIFNALDIVRDLNADGPYTVESVSLEYVDSGGTPAICDVRYQLGSTAAYQLLQFERPSILVLPGATGQYPDVDSDGLIDSIAVTVPIALQFGGTYQWSATLVGSNGQQIAVASGSGSRNPGVSSVLLVFSGASVNASGVDGPYRVKTFLMFGAGQSASVDQVFQTFPISHCVFEGGTGASLTFFRDADGDGFGDATNAIAVCQGAAPGGYVSNSEDCDDTRLLYADDDADGFGAGAPAACGVAIGGDGCPLDANKQAPGFCGCGVADVDSDGNGILDCADVTLTMTASTQPVVVGGVFTVRIASSSSYYPLTGFQIAVHFDVDKLGLVSVVPVTGSPFNLPIANQIDGLAGTLRYAAGISPGAAGVQAPTELVDLVFSVKPDADLCGQSMLARFQSVGNFGSRVSRVGGAQVPITVSLPSLSLDREPPALIGVPAIAPRPADAGSTYGARVTAPIVGAFDNCDGVLVPALLITLPDGTSLTSWPANGMFPVGTSIARWSCRDQAENLQEETVAIVVFNHQLLRANICFEGNIVGAVTRSIRVTAGSAASIHTVPLSGNCGLTLGVQVPVAASYPCIAAKDPVHAITATGAATVVDSHYEVSISLRQGDSNDDDMVDIVDFGLLLDDFGAAAAPDARSNFNGDQFVNNADFAYVAINFFKVGTTCTGALDGAVPLDRISVRELRRRGLGSLAKADLNQDGWLDLMDVQLFTQGGGIPAPGVPIPSGDGGW